MISQLALKQFRNYGMLQLNFSANTVIFLGQNAQGKTSILEAIYLAGLTKSHRAQDDRDMIRYQSPFARISLNHNDDQYELILSKQGKRVSINGVVKPKLSDYVGQLPVMMFSPEDLAIVKGSPLDRRYFLDITLGQLHKPYLLALSQYKKILKQRNELLKNLELSDDVLFLKIMTDQLIKSAEVIIHTRDRFLKKLNDVMDTIYPQFTDDESIKLIYKPSCEKTKLLDTFNKKQKQDIMTNTTNVGPHRDDFGFELNGKEARFASQGQQRSIVLALKLAAGTLFSEKGNKPIMLLDDVLSELDAKRQNKLFDIIAGYGQTFISATTLDAIETQWLEKTQIFKIEKNGAKECDRYE